MQIKHCHSPQRTVYFFSAIREASSLLRGELIALQMRFVAAQKYSMVHQGQKAAEVTKASRGVLRGRRDFFCRTLSSQGCESINTWLTPRSRQRKRGVCVAFIPSHVPAEAVIIHHLPSQNIEPIRKANLSFGECPRVKL